MNSKQLLDVASVVVMLAFVSGSLSLSRERKAFNLT